MFPKKSSACICMCLSDRPLALTQFWPYAFYSSPPHLKLTSKKQTFLSLSGHAHHPGPWSPAHVGAAPTSASAFCVLSPIQHQESLLWMECFCSRENRSLRKLCTGIQTVYSPRRCKLFVMIRPFTTRRAFAHSAECELAGSIGH